MVTLSFPVEEDSLSSVDDLLNAVNPSDPDKYLADIFFLGVYVVSFNLSLKNLKVGKKMSDSTAAFIPVRVDLDVTTYSTYMRFASKYHMDVDSLINAVLNNSIRLLPLIEEKVKPL